MMNSRMKRMIGCCILLLTAAAFFPFSVWAQEQTQVIKNETGFYYTVKKGDTLWDISKKFFDTPWLWPDLWEKNSQLSNPHWIYPGDRLHIFVRNGKVHVEKVVKKTPPPAKPAPTPAPPPEPPYFRYDGVAQVGFIRNPQVTPTGVIFKTEGDRQMISVGDTVYIRQEGTGSMPVGGRFTVYRTMGPVKDPANRKVTLGYQHLFTGVVEITGEETGYALAKVVRSYRTIGINDKVMPYDDRSPKIYLPEKSTSVSGEIVFSEDRTEMMGADTIAFIDKGRRDGVRSGQQYFIYDQEAMKLGPKARKATLLPPEQIGTLVVLHTEQNNATVLVTSSKHEFGDGTKFGTTLQ